MPRKKKNTNETQQTESQSIVDEGTTTNVQTVEDMKAKSSTSIPPIQLKRNEYGLLEDINYKYKEDGFIDWRAMVKPEYLYPNKDRTNETDITKLKDHELVIKLGGLKDLAKIRGFKSVEFITDIPSPNYVCSTCKITWIPNYETEGREVVYSASSSAHYENVNDFLSPFLVEASTNRSFVRAVRSFLNIDIVAHEELFDKNKVVQNNKDNSPYVKESNDAYEPLREVLAKLKLSFSQLKDKCVNAKEHDFKNADNWTKLEDIPKNEVFYLIGVLNKKLDAKN